MARKTKPTEETITTDAVTPVQAVTLSEDQLGRKAEEIKVRIKKADDMVRKADDHYMAAGLILIECQAAVKEAKYKGGWTKWLKDNGIGKSRASELINVANGKTTMKEIRKAAAERQAKHQAKKAKSASNGQSDVDSDTPDRTEDIENWSDELAAEILQKIDDGAHEDRAKFRKWLLKSLTTFGLDCAG